MKPADSLFKYVGRYVNAYTLERAKWPSQITLSALELAQPPLLLRALVYFSNVKLNEIIVKLGGEI